jgi:5-methyltetrahydrofolate--homocysteine methyltransferase
MDIIGKQFRHHEIFLPDVLMAAKAMNAGLDLLKPLLQESGQIGLGKIVIGTVSGDLHDLGKNLVTIMLKGAGFEVIDLGKDVKPSTFVDTAISENATVIGMSALLTTTMPVMKSVVEILHERGLANSIKTIIGGAPLSDEYAREIGADAYAYDAANAVVKIKELMGV